MDIEQTIELIKNLHEGQYDKQGVTYYKHPVKVMERLKNKTINEDVLIAALLHDVFEDTNTSSQDLKNYGFSSYAIFLVETLTRNINETYKEFIERIISTNNDAIMIKIADMDENLNSSRGDLPSSLKKRYVKNYEKLVNAL